MALVKMSPRFIFGRQDSAIFKTYTSALFALDFQFMPFYWTQDDWNSLDLDQYLIGVIHNQDKEELSPLGFALFRAISGDDFCHLLKICVIPQQRGQNTASALLQECCEFIKSQGFSRVVLEVQESNQRAIAYYSKWGFQRLHTSKAYYKNGDNAVHMELVLGNAS